MPSSPGRRKSPAMGRREDELGAGGTVLVAGVDEVGRGPLAGPVVAAAVILPDGWEDPGVDDSKKLKPGVREELSRIIRSTALAWAMGVADHQEIDSLNIHRASLLAMKRAVEGLARRPEYLLVDGRFTLDLALAQESVVGGDGTCRSIAAASILAKVARDALMRDLHQCFPAYNFAGNKGYGTLQHRHALEIHGPCPYHRRSYAPVAQMALGLEPMGLGPMGLGTDS